MKCHDGTCAPRKCRRHSSPGQGFSGSEKRFGLQRASRRAPRKCRAFREEYGYRRRKPSGIHLLGRVSAALTKAYGGIGLQEVFRHSYESLFCPQKGRPPPSPPRSRDRTGEGPTELRLKEAAVWATVAEPRRRSRKAGPAGTSP